jgi:hypothetical protein
MAKLKRVLEATEHGALSPALRELYTQRGDKFVLDADDAEVLQQALETERQKARTLEATLANYGELTPEQAKKLQEDTARAQREKDVSAGNFQNILDQERDKHVKDMALRDKGEERLRTSLEDALINSEAGRAIRDAGGSEALLLPIVKARAKLMTAGDREVAVIIGDKGGPRLKANAKSADEFMPISEYVAELKADKTYAGAFAANLGSGTGGQRTGQSSRLTGGPGKAQAETAAKIATAVREGATRLTE